MQALSVVEDLVQPRLTLKLCGWSHPMSTHDLDLSNQSIRFLPGPLTKLTNWMTRIFAPILLFVFTTNSNAASLDLEPHPTLTPQEVVEFQLTALQSAADGGIEATFRFASPANKKMTGPIARFSRLFDSAQYQPMLDNKGTEIRLVSNDGFTAELLAGVVDDSGDLHWYRFRLSKQNESPYLNCWMTDAVIAVAHPGRSA